MRDTVRAELFKLRKRPAAWVLLAAAVVAQPDLQLSGSLPVLPGRRPRRASQGTSRPREVLASTLPDQLVINTIGGFPVFAGALALVLGALMFGGEYGWGTVKTMLSQRPGRSAVLGGQLVALAVAMLVLRRRRCSRSAPASTTVIALVEDQPCTGRALRPCSRVSVPAG